MALFHTPQTSTATAPKMNIRPATMPQPNSSNLASEHKSFIFTINNVFLFLIYSFLLFCFFGYFYYLE